MYKLDNNTLQAKSQIHHFRHLESLSWIATRFKINIVARKNVKFKIKKTVEYP